MTKRRWLAYVVALAAAAVAIGVRWLLDPWLGPHIPLEPLYGAVALAVWLGGVRPAVIVVIAGYLAGDYLFIDPRGQLGFSQFRNLVGFIMYVTSCGLLIGFGESLRRARRRS